MHGLLADVRAEHAELDALLVSIDEAGWDRPTPAEGWAVRDQIGHLAYFDEVASTAMVDPDAFAPIAEAVLGAAMRGEDPMADHLARGRALAGVGVLEWWRGARASMVEAAGALVPGARVPWFGPAMSPLSFVSARLMETWAHGQDVADAFGVARVPTARLAHVAQLGVRARPFSYAVRGATPPGVDVRVELRSPDGERWTWNDDAAGGVVRGPALDFCLVVTQRRHVGDTALEIEGDAAEEWMAIAQAFAGPPGPGRPPLSRA